MAQNDAKYKNFALPVITPKQNKSFFLLLEISVLAPATY